MRTGKGVSAGASIGKAFLVSPFVFEILEKNAEDPKREVRKFEAARECVLAHKRELSKKASKELNAQVGDIFTAHCTVLDDEAGVIQPIRNRIMDEKVSAAAAVADHFQYLFETFSSIEDKYMQERACDIKDIKEELLKELLGIKSLSPESLQNIEEPVVVIAKELSPSETFHLTKDKVAGILLEEGGETSHAVILAKALGIPMIIGCPGLLDSCEDNDLVCMDGQDGRYSVNPEKEELDFFVKRERFFEKKRESEFRYKGKKSVTKDGHQIEVLANISSSAIIDSVIDHDAEGIGLFRSEFLYLDSESYPDEDMQLKAYKQVLAEMKGKPVIIRTMDIGGDKDVPYMNLPQEANPFLGYRAIRIALHNKEIFKTQIRALLRASVCGNLSIMFPMVSSISEYREAAGLLRRWKEELMQEGCETSNTIKIGLMIETPAAAVMAEELAAEADFFSIGTNDLIQYTMAADRGNQQVAELYSPFEPSVLRLIRHISDSAGKKNIPCGMCGQAAEIKELIPLWIGMGLTELSVNPGMILECRETICGLEYVRCRALVSEVMRCSTRKEAEEILKQV